MTDKYGKAKTILLTLLVMVLWGSLFAFVKWDMLELGISSKSNPFDTILFAGARFLISGFLLSIFVLIFQRKQNPIKKAFTSKKSLLAVMAVGVVGFALHYSLTYLGLQTIDSGKASLIKQAGVLIFVCFSFLFFKEDKFSWQKIVAAVLGAASIIVTNLEAFTFSFSYECLYLVGASFCTVIANVAFKKLAGESSPLAITAFAMFFGGLVLTILGLSCGGRFSHITNTSVYIFAFIVVATIVSYGLWYSIVYQFELSKLFIIKMAEPLFATVVSVMIPALNTKLGYELFIAFVLVALAVYISNAKFHKKEQKEELAYESNDRKSGN